MKKRWWIALILWMLAIWYPLSSGPLCYLNGGFGKFHVARTTVDWWTRPWRSLTYGYLPKPVTDGWVSYNTHMRRMGYDHWWDKRFLY